MSRNILYVVYVAEGLKRYPVYETTKEKEAYEFIRRYQRTHDDVERMYIDKEVITRFNKRDLIEDENL